MADTYYSDVATSQNAALTNAASAATLKDEQLFATAVLTLSGASVVNDVHRLQYIPAGAVIDWGNAVIVSTNAALAGTIGLVNASTGAYTAYGTLTAASNIGRLTAPTQTPASFSATTVDNWLAYQLGASPATSGSAKISVGRKVLAD